MSVKQIIPFFIIISVLSIGQTFAQDSPVERGEVLSAMNSFDGLGFDSAKEAQLKEANENAVNRIFDIAKSDESPEIKKSLFKNAREENSKLFKGILDEKDFKKYKKSVKKKLKPFKRRAKLVGFLL